MARPVPVDAEAIHDCDQPGAELCTPLRVELQQLLAIVFGQFFADTLEAVIGLVRVGSVPAGDHHDGGCVRIQELRPRRGCPRGIEAKQKLLDRRLVANLLF